MWRYEYDAAGGLVAERDFNGRVVRYHRDAAGQVVARATDRGDEVRYLRDATGKVVERRVGDVVERFEYDAVGRLVGADNPDARLVLRRDALGRVTEETVNGRTVSSVHDAIGRHVRRTTPSGAVSHWRYGVTGRPEQLVSGGRAVGLGYDASGRLTERVAGPTTISQSWDPAGRLGSQSVVVRDGLVQRRDYRYDRTGALTGVADLLGGDRALVLDAGSRVTEVVGDGWHERYAYDAAGNITHAEWPGGEASGPREHAGAALVAAGGTRYRYDNHGRVVQRTRKRLSRKPDTWHYRWDANDRLVEVTTPDGARWRYLHDPLGRRVAKLRLDGAGVVVERVDFCWDGLVLAEQITSGGVATTWDFEPGTFTPLCQAERVLDGDREWVDRAFYSIVTDLVGAPSELVDGGGAVEWRRRANVWGASQSGDEGTPLRFPGQYYDAESGLHYNNARYYDPETGRYTSMDPLGLAPGPNPQAYVPNPTGAIDPLGLSPCRTYYSVQSPADADRLINNGGEPWPSGVDANGRRRSELGDGLYAWESRDQAERYLDAVSGRPGGPTDLSIIEHRISGEDYDGLRHADMTRMSDDAATDLWNAGGRHDYDHIQRGAGRFGNEHYFRNTVFDLVTSRRGGS
ncbi:RHS repeat-associated core domain-containing protein [Actinosynnema mirum]|uniref:RHS repeat-associated core domain-containing protein n=1 Tax=Actinosynnema mirum TaxID=40567 RepID=UPI00019AB429|nr:RHS repeat-associated core domain-containing protein [Actinosynnema mirum]